MLTSLCPVSRALTSPRTSASASSAGVAHRPGRHAVGRPAAQADYTGVSVDVPSHQVKLYWKGTPPAPHALAELDSEAHRIASENPEKVTAVGPRADYAGLDVTVDRSVTSRIPLTFASGNHPAPATNRWDDATPFWGGSVIVRPSGLFGQTACSTAFGGHTCDGRNVMVTSYHCGQNVDWHTPTGWLFGHANGGYKHPGAAAVCAALGREPTAKVTLPRGRRWLSSDTRSWASRAARQNWWTARYARSGPASTSRSAPTITTHGWTPRVIRPTPGRYWVPRRTRPTRWG